MIYTNYIGSVGDSIEYLIALGSIIGMLGLIFGLMLMLVGGKSFHHTALPIVITSFIIVAICGLQTGVKYFRI